MSLSLKLHAGCNSPDTSRNKRDVCRAARARSCQTKQYLTRRHRAGARRGSGALAPETTMCSGEPYTAHSRR